MINSETGKDKLGQIAALYRKSGIGKRMALLSAMNFSTGMLQGMEVLIYMCFVFFFKLQMRKSSTRDIPFTNLAKTKKRRASRIKVYLQCGELSPDNPTGRRFPLIFFSFVLFFFFSLGENSFVFSFAD